jgi:hypothetical protein
VSAPGKGVSVQDLIQAGLIRPPTLLVKRYKGRDFAAQIESDGRVTYEGATYNSLSEAAGSAALCYWKFNGAPLPSN